MAFYNDVPGKKEKIRYADQGSWDEEGTHYRDKRNSSSKGKSASQSGKGSYSGKRNDHTEGYHTKGSYSSYDGRNTGSGKKEGYRGNQRRGEPDRGYEKNKGYEQGRKYEGGNRRNSREANKSIENEADYRDYEFRSSSAREELSAREEGGNILCGRNPIREALKSDRDIEKLLVQKGSISGSARDIVQTAREKKILVQEVEKSRLDEIAPHHQGLIAFASAYEYSQVEDMLHLAEERKEAPFLILLDGVTDPHNLGAIIRTAECAGAHGVIVPLHRSVGLTPAAVKASAGAIEHIPVARVTNLNRTLEDLKKKGLWIYAVTMEGKDYEKVSFHDGTALVIGAEGEGISRLTLEKCDMSVSLPMRGHLDSLNASVAAGIVMYRVLSSRK